MSTLSSSIKALVDSVSGGRVTIDFVTALVHVGKVFRISMYDAALADTNSQELLIQVGDNEIHINVTVSVLGDFEVFLFEGTTVSDDGTPVVPLNLNRTSSLVSAGTFSTSPTITGDGTELAHAVLPGGQRNQAIENEVGGDGEVILAPNTIYLLRSTNFSGGASRVSTSIVFYEPDLG